MKPVLLKPAVNAIKRAMKGKRSKLIDAVTGSGARLVYTAIRIEMSHVKSISGLLPISRAVLVNGKKDIAYYDVGYTLDRGDSLTIDFHKQRGTIDVDVA